MKYINFKRGEKVKIISCTGSTYTHLIGEIGTIDYGGLHSENEIMHLSRNKWQKNFLVKDLQKINPEIVYYETY